jgi:hypothetical protein
MLMRFDPFRELDRLTEQLASTASRAPRAFRWTRTAVATGSSSSSTCRASIRRRLS